VIDESRQTPVATRHLAGYDEIVADSPQVMRRMLKLIRLHHTGTRATIRQHPDGGWRINLDIKEPNHPAQSIVGYLSPTLEKAKEVADSEILRYGHNCSALCKVWEDA
jgi:hypothetical protein